MRLVWSASDLGYHGPNDFLHAGMTVKTKPYRLQYVKLDILFQVVPALYSVLKEKSVDTSIVTTTD